MIDPASGPFLFDASAASYLDRTTRHAEREWLRSYVARFPIHVSVITVIERMRGYALLLERIDPAHRSLLETEKEAYLQDLHAGLRRAVPLSTAAALVAAQLMALCPTPPSPPRRAHRLMESRQERLSRWRFDILIASTALVLAWPLVHNNATDFEFLRGLIEQRPERFPEVGPLNLVLVKRLVES